MKLRWPRLIALGVVALSLLATAATSSSNCGQTYELLGVTRGSEPVAWIGVDRNGECYSSHLVLVSVVDGETTEVPSRGFRNWGIMQDAVDRLERHGLVEFSADEAGWFMEDVRVMSPPQDANLARAFDAHVGRGGSDGATWIEEEGESGIVSPLINGEPAQVVCAYSGGLYVNYGIARVVGIRGRDEVIVFTHQEKLAVGHDTMHGFLVVRRKE